MMRRLGSSLLFALSVTACDAELATPTDPLNDAPPLAAAQSGGGLYQLQFITEDPQTQGEITSEPFPAGGVQLNERDPWRDLEVPAAWSLNNYTHGSWGQGTCTRGEAPVNWDIAGTDPVRSFAGSWAGTLKFWRNRGMHFYLDGNRTSGIGGIHNIASNRNAAIEDEGVDSITGKRWFKITFQDAGMKFGGPSYPDDQGTLSETAEVEAACGNFVVLATEM